MRPMKGEVVLDSELSKLRFPLLGSYKYDGLRVVIPYCKPLTSKMKDIPNLHIRKILSDPRYTNLDGELIIGLANTEGVFNRTQSGVMSHGGEPNFRLFAFDLITDSDMPYSERLRVMTSTVEQQDPPFVRLVKQVELFDLEDLLKFEQRALNNGYEGIMLRDPHGVYKHGRSTIRQQYLLKRKPFIDAEGTVVDIYEQMENTNESKMNELGLNKRSKKQEGMVPKGTLGGFTLQTKWGLLDCATGEGLTKKIRQQLWDERVENNNYKGWQVTFKFMPYGMKDKPRHPIFRRFRDRRG